MGNARSAADDLKAYRDGYPDKEDDETANDNYLFYTGKIGAKPNRDTITDFHTKWWGDYYNLEVAHDYIQWLFPIREKGLNWHAQELQLHEAKRMREDPEIQQTMLTSYKLILDFWGMRVKDEATGEIERHDNYRAQYQNLEAHGHNHLRMTRVLKWLGEIGLEHYKKPWLKFLVTEMFVNDELRSARNSCENYFVPTLKNDADREELLQFIRDNKKPEPPPAYSSYGSYGGGGAYGGGGGPFGAVNRPGQGMRAQAQPQAQQATAQAEAQPQQEAPQQQAPPADSGASGSAEPAGGASGGEL